MGVVLEIRTYPDGGRGVVCESSDVRKFLKKSKFHNFSELFKVKTRNYNRSRFQYESVKIEKCVKIEKFGRGRPGRWFWKFGHTRTRGGGGLKSRDFGGRPL